MLVGGKCTDISRLTASGAIGKAIPDRAIGIDASTNCRGEGLVGRQLRRLALEQQRAAAAAKAIQNRLIALDHRHLVVGIQRTVGGWWIHAVGAAAKLERAIIDDVQLVLALPAHNRLQPVAAKTAGADTGDGAQKLTRVTRGRKVGGIGCTLHHVRGRRALSGNDQLGQHGDIIGRIGSQRRCGEGRSDQATGRDRGQRAGTHRPPVFKIMHVDIPRLSRRNRRRKRTTAGQHPRPGVRGQMLATMFLQGMKAYAASGGARGEVSLR